MHTPQTSCLPMQAQQCEPLIWPTGFCSKPDHHAPVAQLVEHRAVTREVVSLTPAGPTLRVFK